MSDSDRESIPLQVVSESKLPDTERLYSPKLSEAEMKLRKAADDKEAARKRKMTASEAAIPPRRFTVLDEEHEFVDNTVTTSKYTFYNFLFKNMAEQFRRIANIYFLIISALQLSTDLSPTSKYATVLPLTIVLMVTLIKELYEDWGRHKADNEINARVAKRLTANGWEDTAWSDVKVGQILRVSNKASIPADMLVLSTNDHQGTCYVNTANLDGEDNLKLKQGLVETQNMKTGEDLLSFKAEMKCDPPNDNLYAFKGTLSYGEKQIPVDLVNVVWRGSTLQNTQWMHGLVIYTGQESKLIQNMRPVPAKRSDVERTVDNAIIVIFITLGVMCGVSSGFHSSWLDTTESKGSWYLTFLQGFSTKDEILTLITFLILYNNLVPISLYVSLELVKLVQSRFINYDLQMYHGDTDTPAMARTSNLNEDLGQIQYVFSDKTGTLTCNEMEFKMCTVNGVMYGHTDSGAFDTIDEEDSISDFEAKSTDRLAPPRMELDSGNIETSVAQRKHKKIKKRRGMAGYNFDDQKFRADLQGKGKQAARLHEFGVALSVCHSVIPERENDELMYMSQSPDEEALVTAARYLGYEFSFRGPKYITVTIHGKDQRYDILNVNEFSSDRKRMSVVVRTPEGKIKVYCKGADDVMIKSVVDDDLTISRLKNHLIGFASEGLRTLVITERELEPGFYKEWNKQFFEAKNLLQGRDEALAKLAARVERKMTLIGATAIEDKLQDGVPETIEKLTQAGIKVWMLTGDKLETAQNIGFSCHLLQPGLDIARINEDNARGTGVVLARHIKKYKDYIGGNNENLAVIVTGQSLSFVFNDDDDFMRTMFLELIKMAKVVIACRVIPAQKAEIVRLIRDGVTPKPMTLAIGDGANDVAMIQVAHVGIGLSGNEGMQAVRASDYAIGQFRFLQKLLLVHGRWNYRRVSLLILYSFYKNITNVLTLFYYGFSNAFSGTTLYESWLGAGWNVGWTLFPVLFFGFFEQDMGAEAALANPHAYIHGQRHLEFNFKKISIWLFNAILHSLIIFGLTVGSFSQTGGTFGEDGKPIGLFLMGTMINFCTVLTVNYKICLETHFWNPWTFIGFIGSLVIWCCFVYVYSFLIDISFDFYGVGWQLFNRPHFYLLVLLVPVAAILFDLTFLHIRQQYFPSPLDIIRELEQEERHAAKASGRKPNYNFLRHQGIKRLRTVSMKGQVSSASLLKGQDDDEEEVILGKLRHLNEVLRGSEAAVYAQKDVVEQRNTRLTNDVQMARFTLAFTNIPERLSTALETEFQVSYVRKSIKFVRNAFYLVFFLLVLYTLYSGITGQEGFLFRVFSCVGAFVFIVFIHSRFFFSFFHEIIFVMLITVGILRTLLVQSNGAIGLGMTAVAAFLVFRVKFSYAFIAVAIDFVFFNIYTTAQRDIFNGREMVEVDYLHLSLVGYVGVIAYQAERAFRKDFLLQEEYGVEQARSQEIIDNIMPTYITKQMRKTMIAKYKGGKGSGYSRAGSGMFDVGRALQFSDRPLIANDEGQVSIVFCDIMGFSTLVASHSPSTIVAILDGVYSTFDELCLKHGVQKMETVGKTYMACAGLQGTRLDHAHACAELAEEIIVLMAECQDQDGNPLHVRIGINTGKVISGVVGLKRPQFSLFGDTVNTSSRMCSTGSAGHIHVSPDTYALLHGDYSFIHRKTPVKGKGIMDTYYLKNRITKLPNNKNWVIVEAKHDEDAVKEAKLIIKESTTTREFDPSEVNSKVQITKPNLRFISDEKEFQFNDAGLEVAGKISRRPLLIAMIFFTGEAIFEYFEAKDASNANPSHNLDRDLTVIFGVRYGCVFLASVLFVLSYTLHFARYAAEYLTVFFFICMLGTVAVVDETEEKIDTRASLTFIFMITLLSNSGVVRFIVNVGINILAIIVFIVAIFAFSGGEAGDVTDDGSVTDAKWELIFFMVAGATINAIAAYSREFYQRREFLLTEQVVTEKHRSERLLYDMLPRPVAEDIKSGHTSIADAHNGVSILYSDIKGFTKYSSTTKNPSNVVKLLSDLFTKFDSKTDFYSVYKIQTIGDAYVLVGGLPFTGSGAKYEPSPKEDAHNVIQMAMHMHDSINSTSTVEGSKIKMRIGVHTGRILAGVIGSKQLRYDIWGPDCLVANTLESEGVPGGICISQQTRWHLEDLYAMIEYKSVKVSSLSYKIETSLIHYPLDQPERKYCINWEP